MLTLLLNKRDDSLVERMSDLECDLQQLNNTYRNFLLINRLIAGWRRVYERNILPLRPRTLLDIGCGGGDVALTLATWSKQDGLDLDITAIDPDPRALAFAKSRPQLENVTFQRAFSSDLVKDGKQFDIVVSNHLLHHLTKPELENLCKDSETLATHKVIHNDICRSDLAYLGFSLTAPFFRNSFITYDGLISIRRSFTRHELRQVIPKKWRVEALFPYRNLLLFEP